MFKKISFRLAVLVAATLSCAVFFGCSDNKEESGSNNSKESGSNNSTEQTAPKKEEKKEDPKEVTSKITKDYFKNIFQGNLEKIKPIATEKGYSFAEQMVQSMWGIKLDVIVSITDFSIDGDKAVVEAIIKGGQKDMVAIVPVIKGKDGKWLVDLYPPQGNISVVGK